MRFELTTSTLARLRSTPEPVASLLLTLLREYALHNLSHCFIAFNPLNIYLFRIRFYHNNSF